MFSYTNKDGTVVEVSKEHLDTAVKIKKELQRMNNSMRCSWAKHKELMMEEGFTDSENSESYRQMIKRYQKSIGELPSSAKYSEMVVDSKLKSIQNAVGEMAWQKREIQNEARKLGKLKRDIVDKGLLVSEVSLAVKDVLSEMDFKDIMKDFEYKPFKNRGNNRLIAVMSDWHIGALVDTDINKYNYEIAERRINQYINEIYNLAIEKNVSRIDVVYMGDLIEHLYMRPSQAYNVEFPVSVQMVKGARLINKVLFELSKHWIVSYTGFSGNHDRLDGDKNKVVYGDNAMVVANEIVSEFINTSNIENLIYRPTGKYSNSLINVNGKNIKFVHGDKERKNDQTKLAKHSEKDGVHYDAIVYGHFHHYLALEVGYKKWEIRCGSIKGSDEYSDNLGVSSSPSQLAIVVYEDGKIEPKMIALD